MLCSKDYYSYLYDYLIKKNANLFKDCDNSKLTALPLPSEMFDELISLLNEIYRKYEFNMQKTCSINYNLFTLWEINNSNYVNYENILIAIKFILFGCLADKILDSQRFSKSEKEKVIEKLDIRVFVSEKPFISDCFKEMDILLNDIRCFLVSETAKKSPYYEIIIRKMEQAFLSEVYMSQTSLKLKEKMLSSEMRLLIDKSVEFETVAFFIASISNITDRTMASAKCISEIFWLVDDLCDFVDDIKCKRKNSVLFYCTPMDEEINLVNRVDLAFSNLNIILDKLENNIFTLNQIVKPQLFDFVINQIWVWCYNVRRMVE